MTDHRLDIRMGDCVEFVVLELVRRTDVDVRAFVLGRVAVFGRGEDCSFGVSGIHTRCWVGLQLWVYR